MNWVCVPVSRWEQQSGVQPPLCFPQRTNISIRSEPAGSFLLHTHTHTHTHACIDTVHQHRKVSTQPNTGAHTRSLHPTSAAPYTPLMWEWQHGGSWLAGITWNRVVLLAEASLQLSQRDQRELRCVCVSECVWTHYCWIPPTLFLSLLLSSSKQQCACVCVCVSHTLVSQETGI